MPMSQQRAAAVCAPGADVVGLDLLEKVVEKKRGCADVAAPDVLDRLQVRALEVQAVGDHQLDAVVRAGAAIMRSASRLFVAIGFSHSTWTPARAARTV